MTSRDEALGVRESFRADMAALDAERSKMEACLHGVEEALDEMDRIGQSYRRATAHDGCDTLRLDAYAEMAALRARSVSAICEERAAALRAGLAENDRRREERAALFHRRMAGAAAADGPARGHREEP